MTKHRIVLCAVLAFAAFSVAACGGTSRERLVIATPDEPFPHATLSDIVSYADQLSIVRVIDDRPGRMTPEEVAAGEGYLPRFGTVVIERTLWSRKAAPPPPSDA